MRSGPKQALLSKGRKPYLLWSLHARRPFAGTSFEKKKAVPANEACTRDGHLQALLSKRRKPYLQMKPALLLQVLARRLVT
jgi:hypothetical protein